MDNGSVGLSGFKFDAFVSSQQTFNDYDLASRIKEKYYLARQKFLSKVEKKEDSCIVLSDSKLDAKLDIYRSIRDSSSRLTDILERFETCLFVLANEENSLGLVLKEHSKYDKTKAGKIMSIAGKGLTSSSHQRIQLYMPIMRIYQDMETFYNKAVHDTSMTVDSLESKRSQYRASLLWMKDVSENLDPDIYKQLDKFRRVQNQVRKDKRVFDAIKMDVVQKIDLLMASRCNLLNQILGPYQNSLQEAFEKNAGTFAHIEQLIKQEDIYGYEFKALKELNPLKLDDNVEMARDALIDQAPGGSNINQSNQFDDEDFNNNNNLNDNAMKNDNEEGTLINLSLDDDEIGQELLSGISSLKLN